MLRARGQAEKVLVLHAAVGVCDPTVTGSIIDTAALDTLDTALDAALPVPPSEPPPSASPDSGQSGGATRVFFRVSNQVSQKAMVPLLGQLLCRLGGVQVR